MNESAKTRDALESRQQKQHYVSRSQRCNNCLRDVERVVNREVPRHTLTDAERQKSDRRECKGNAPIEEYFVQALGRQDVGVGQVKREQRSDRRAHQIKKRNR